MLHSWQEANLGICGRGEAVAVSHLPAGENSPMGFCSSGAGAGTCGMHQQSRVGLVVREWCPGPALWHGQGATPGGKGLTPKGLRTRR